MRRIFLAFVLCANAFGSLPADPADDALAYSTTVVSTGVPLVATSILLAQYAIPALQGVAPWIASPTLLGTHIPMYWLDARRAGWYTAAGLALPATGITTMIASGGDPLLLELSSSFLTAYNNLMLFSSYDVSLEARSLVGVENEMHIPPDDARLRAKRLTRLLSAPFSEHLFDPIVWIPSLIGPAALTAWYLGFEYDGVQSVGESGMAFIGDKPVSPAVGGVYTLVKNGVDLLSISVGEEAYYRGVLYDSIQRNSNRAVARTIDAILFPLIHLPTDLQQGFKPETIAFNFAWRSVMTIVFDMAYDKGGLPLATSVHYWSDLVLLMSRWWFYGGTLE